MPSDQTRPAIRLRPRLEALEDRLCLSSATPVGTVRARAVDVTAAQPALNSGQLPLSFEANRGRTDSQAGFRSGGGGSLFLTPAQAMPSLKHGENGHIVGMSVVGANPASRTVGLDNQPGVSNVLIGNDPSQ
jgi:hypothetical protein